MRPYGLVSAAVVLVGSILVFLLSDESTGGRLGSAGPAAAWSLGMILFFGLVVRPSWVRVPAEAYAERLVGAAEALRGQAAASRQP